MTPGVGLSLAQEKVQSREGAKVQSRAGDRGQDPLSVSQAVEPPAREVAVPLGMAHWVPPAVFWVWTRV